MLTFPLLYYQDSLVVVLERIPLDVFVPESFEEQAIQQSLEAR